MSADYTPSLAQPNPNRHTTVPAIPDARAPRAIRWLLAPMTLKRGVGVLLAGLAAAVALVPIDAWTMTTLGPFGGLSSRMGGDLVRELEFLQQFGAITSMLIAASVILLLDRPRARRILDIAIAMLVNGLICNALKISLGRPRPRVIFHDHAMEGFSSPAWFGIWHGSYPLPRLTGDGQVAYVWARAWDFGKGISSDLWSMPSSHAAAAACAAACLIRLYPRLWPLLVALALTVPVCRVIFGAHYPSDVVFGSAVGWIVGARVMDRRFFSPEKRSHTRPSVNES